MTKPQPAYRAYTCLDCGHPISSKAVRCTRCAMRFRPSPAKPAPVRPPVDGRVHAPVDAPGRAG